MKRLATHVGVTGPRSEVLSPAQSFEFGRVLGGLLTDGVVVHHGDCIGVDADVARLLGHYGIPVIVHPPVYTDYRAFTDQMANVIEVREPKDFLIRNHEIVDECDLLIAFPDGPERIRSGTWATIRYACNRGVPVRVVYPNGSREERDERKS